MAVGTLLQSESEKTIMRQMLQATIPIQVFGLLQTMSKLKMVITNIVGDNAVGQEHNKPTEKPTGNLVTDPMLLTMGIGRKSAIVKMEIMGCKLTNAIIDKGSSVNVLQEETWKVLGKPPLWPLTFHLVGADQHDIKPLGMLIA